MKSVNNNELLFVIPYAPIGFSDESHLKNFINYLFSTSGSHRENDLTSHNFFVDYIDKPYFDFNNNPKVETSKFKEKLKNFISPGFRYYSNDILEFLFMVIVNGKIVSNFLEYDKNSNAYKFILTGNNFVYTIKNYFNDSPELFNNKIGEFLEFFKKYPFVPFKECDLNDKLIIEKHLHKKARLAFKDSDRALLISVSHNDQLERNYHIHRLFQFL